MSYKFDEGKDLIIEEVISRVNLKMDANNARLCAEFIRQFYGTASLEDLKLWDVEDLYGAAVNFWSLIQVLPPKSSKIRIYNPDFELHGWQSTHTVIEFIGEDMPFLVDTIRMVLNRMGFATHLIVHMGGIKLLRDKDNKVSEVLDRNDDKKGMIVDAPIFIEIDRQTDPKTLDLIQKTIEKALEDNSAVVHDWQPMRDKVREAIKELEGLKTGVDKAELAETIAFLNWIEDHHFTFLGVRDYELVKKDNDMILQPLMDTGLGILHKSNSTAHSRSISAMTPEARELMLSPRILVTTKNNVLSTVHRDTDTDYIGVKRFDKKGNVIGERRIIGLYTSAAYNTNPKHIPFLRHKVALVLEKSELNARSHAGRVLMNILETLPRDDLIQASVDEILDISMGIFQMQERRRIRLFARVDLYHRFVSCLVYVPKDIFSTDLRLTMQDILKKRLKALTVTFSTTFTESVLARVHFMLRIDPNDHTEFNFSEIERELIEAARSWQDDLQHFLGESFGEEEGNQLFAKYRSSFPVAYCENFSPRTAVNDIKHIEQISKESPLGMNFYRPVDESSENFRLKIYQHATTIPLSEVLPIVEHLGMKAISERPYQLKFEDGSSTWVNEFSLQYTQPTNFELDDIKDLFQNSFVKMWFGDAENDGFNKLVLGAELNWRQVAILRTYAKYFKQIRFTFSQDYIEKALNNNAHITKKLFELFETRFKPDANDKREERFARLVEDIMNDLSDVTNLDEDKILRQYVHTISGTLRTNFYQCDNDGTEKSYISIKLHSKNIPGVPKPYPLYEIFVYSPRVEGVHLRGGKVARGGIRWSDRREDFRTEVLGLMKAQQVKNSVIVPSGAKGGFYPKRTLLNATRDVVFAEGVNCYKLFIRALLDITDNYVQGKVVKPDYVLCYDEDDPYLVVAADKGTATFSDIANEISLEYGFWLGDAFASGGSNGYDHKKMAITAKGAWESVKRHFNELGVNIQKTDFTVVGIGDMAGDVFGNGMLLSPHIRLVAAFNHVHIFVDPHPDASSSIKERERLFNLPRSTWMDYDKKLISAGGGVFDRSAKSIKLSKEMKEVFQLSQDEIEPNDLIKAILRSKVDLLWSGGIGTFVKAQSETHLDVGDRTNDGIRVNATELRCKVIGEGGNLGVTQLARIEYALNGGLNFTDFIDNSGGVNCSDKEVNIKILLNSIVATGDLTTKQRNELLSKMTDEVSSLVLSDNYAQPRAISLTAHQALRSSELHIRYINELEKTGKLDRGLEFIPEEKVLLERRVMGKGLGRPGIAVLFCYSKMILKEAILASNVPEDAYFKQTLINYFPKPLQDKYSLEMSKHPLKREIIATKLSNIIVNEMNFTFVHRLQEETGAPVSAIVRAYMIARDVLGLETIWRKIELLDSFINFEKQSEMMMLYLRLMRRVTRWFLRNQRMRLDISKSVKQYVPGIAELKKCFPQILGKEGRAWYEKQKLTYIEMGISDDLAHEFTVTRGLFSAMDIIEVAQQLNVSITKVAELYYGLGEFLEIGWIRSQVIAHTTENNWESLSREALRDDLDWQQRQLTAGIISASHGKLDVMDAIDVWSASNKVLIERWRHILSELQSTPSLNYTMYFVAIRELLDLTQTTQQMAEKMELA